MLDQAWCADEAEGASGTADGCVDGSCIIDLIRNENVADTLARQGEGFAVGVADQRVFVIFCQIRYFCFVIGKFTIRLI